MRGSRLTSLKIIGRQWKPSLRFEKSILLRKKNQRNINNYLRCIEESTKVYGTYGKKWHHYKLNPSNVSCAVFLDLVITRFARYLIESTLLPVHNHRALGSQRLLGSIMRTLIGRPPMQGQRRETS